VCPLCAEPLTEAFENYYDRRRCGALELYVVGPNGLEYCLINEDFVDAR
jgi:hypothetical protein